MPTLEDALAKAFAPIVAELARKTAEALQSMPMADALAALGLERRTAPRTSPKLVRNRAKVASKAPAVEVQASVKAAVAALKRTPGIGSEAIGKALGLDKKARDKVIAAGLADGALRKKGVKRATTYYAK